MAEQCVENVQQLGAFCLPSPLSLLPLEHAQGEVPLGVLLEVLDQHAEVDQE